MVLYGLDTGGTYDVLIRINTVDASMIMMKSSVLVQFLTSRFRSDGLKLVLGGYEISSLWPITIELDINL